MTYAREKRLLLGLAALLAPLPLPFNQMLEWTVLALFEAGVVAFPVARGAGGGRSRSSRALAFEPGAEPPGARLSAATGSGYRGLRPDPDAAAGAASGAVRRARQTLVAAGGETEVADLDGDLLSLSRRHGDQRSPVGRPLSRGLRESHRRPDGAFRLPARAHQFRTSRHRAAAIAGAGLPGGSGSGNAARGGAALRAPAAGARPLHHGPRRGRRTDGGAGGILRCHESRPHRADS